MAFAKKVKAATTDTRPKGNALVQREARVQFLKAANTPEARAALKKMNDKVYRGAGHNVGDWFAPKGMKVNVNY